jgi:uncharacterized protein YjbJ (UPF0337 family)
MADFNVDTGSNGSRISEATSSGVGKVKEQLGEAADRAKSRIDSARQPVADKLHGAADTIREQASRLPGGEKVAGVAQGAADTLESSAAYIESHDAQQMAQDLLAIVKRHPAQALIFAGALGFLVARALRSD